MNQKNTQNSAMPRPYKLAGVALAVSLTACGGGDGPSVVPTTEAATAPANGVPASGTSSSTGNITPSVKVTPTANTPVVTVDTNTASSNSGANNPTDTAPAIVPPTSVPIIDNVIANMASQKQNVKQNEITGDNTPQFNGSLAYGISGFERVTIFNGDKILGVATVNKLSWQFTPEILPDGKYTIVAKVITGDGVVKSVGNPFSFTVKYVPPVVNNTPSINPIKPDVSANDLTDTIIGYDAATMEASLNQTSWSSTLPDLSGNKTAYIRYKNPASYATVLQFTANAVAIVVADPAPIAGGAFASLADMTISDASGDLINPIYVGGVTDPLGRTIVYSATDLPAGLSINSSTGVISGSYDAGLPIERFTVTVKAQANGSTQSASKQFVLSIRNDG